MNHNHIPGMFGGHSNHHICMWETPVVAASAAEINHEVAKSQNQSHLEEIQRLRSLLDANNIKWTKPTPSATLKPFPKTLRQATISWGKKLTLAPPKPEPEIPTEIIIKIIGYAVTHPHAIIDPFWKLQPQNLTKREQRQATLYLNFLLTCRAFKVEGTRLLFANNSFIFTQVQALQNFSNIALEQRITIEKITLRVVGQYFDAVASKRALHGDLTYHDDLEAPTVWVQARPSGSGKDAGMQAYCWEQVSAFLQALVLRSSKGQLIRLLPFLKTMRLDLVNFCEHLPPAGSNLISVVRWYVGHLVDELVITGLACDEFSDDERRYLEFLVKDEGIMIATPPTYVSIVHSKGKHHLRRLSTDDNNLSIHIVRPKTSLSKKNKKQPHPEGGSPPRSIHPPGITTWKWTSDSLGGSEKRWIEFHIGCGLPVTMCGELRDEYETTEGEVDEDDFDEEDEDDSASGGWEDAEGNAEPISSDLD